MAETQEEQANLQESKNAFNNVIDAIDKAYAKKDWLVAAAYWKGLRDICEKQMGMCVLAQLLLEPEPEPEA